MIKNYKYLDYTDERFIDFIIQKTLIYSKNLYLDDELTLRNVIPFFILGLNHHNRTLKIVDYGGAAGIHYFQTKNLFSNLALEWNIVEVAELVEKCSRIPELKNIKFTSNIENIHRPIDLVIANSSLQYSQNPLLVVERMISLDPEYIYIARQPLFNNNENQIVVDQISDFIKNGPQVPIRVKNNLKCRNKMTILPKDIFLALFNLNYQVKIEFVNYFKINNEIQANQYTFLFKRISKV